MANLQSEQPPSGVARSAAPPCHDAIVVVFPGRLCTAADRMFGAAAAEAARAAIVRALDAFTGHTCIWIADREVGELQGYPSLTGALSRLMQRTAVHATIYADQIGARRMQGAAHDVAADVMRQAGLRRGCDSLLLTGAWWDGTDEPIDLLLYAFIGMGFKTALDMAALRPSADRN